MHVLYHHEYYVELSHPRQSTRTKLIAPNYGAWDPLFNYT